MSIRTAATAAYTKTLTDLQADAITALRAAIADADGKPVVPLAGLTRRHVDIEARLVVVTDASSDPPVHLAVQDRDGDGTWTVHLVDRVDREWVRGPAVASLADIGRFLAGEDR